LLQSFDTLGNAIQYNIGRSGTILDIFTTTKKEKHG